MAVTRHNLFKPSRSEVRHEATDQTARAIIDAEVTQREAKTERLRAARMARAAEDAALPDKTTAPRRAAARSRAKS